MRACLARSFSLVALSLAMGNLGCSDVDDPGGGGAGGASGPATANGPSSVHASSATNGASASTSSSTSDAASGSGGAGGGAACAPMPLCDAALPDVGPVGEWNNTSSEIVAALGAPTHRGRDMFYNPGDDLWVMAKFAYGITDSDIHGEDVDVWIDRDCGSTWQKLDTVQTTNDGEHATVDGVEDTGGRVYYQVPPSLNLGLGRHRFLLVVQGDLSSAEVFVDIVPQGTPIVVSDVDGTLTTSENAEFGALLTGNLPDANADAPDALTLLALKGYRVLYLTARPEWLGARTREFIGAAGFPEGLYHTTLSFTGATGQAAADFKTAELAALAARGLVPTYAFGNTSTDADAYENANVQPLTNRIFYQFDDTAHGGRRIDAYADLLPELASLSNVCP